MISSEEGILCYTDYYVTLAALPNKVGSYVECVPTQSWTVWTLILFKPSEAHLSKLYFRCLNRICVRISLATITIWNLGKIIDHLRGIHGQRFIRRPIALRAQVSHSDFSRGHHPTSGHNERPFLHWKALVGIAFGQFHGLLLFQTPKKLLSCDLAPLECFEFEAGV